MGGCVLFVRDSFSVWMKDESSDESSEFLLCLISLFRHLKAISLCQRLAKQRLNSSHHLTYSLSSCSLNSNLSSTCVLEGLPWWRDDDGMWKLNIWCPVRLLWWRHQGCIQSWSWNSKLLKCKITVWISIFPIIAVVPVRPRTHNTNSRNQK